MLVCCQGIYYTCLLYTSLLDRWVCDLNVGDPLILTNDLLDGLFAVGCHRSVTPSLLLQLLFLAVGHVLADGGFEMCIRDRFLAVLLSLFGGGSRKSDRDAGQGLSGGWEMCIRDSR